MVRITYLCIDFKKVAVDVGERLGQDAAYVIDSSKARKEFDWKPLVSIEEGLSGVIDWIEKNERDIKECSLEYVHKA